MTQNKSVAHKGTLRDTRNREIQSIEVEKRRRARRSRAKRSKRRGLLDWEQASKLLYADGGILNARRETITTEERTLQKGLEAV